MGKKLDLKYGDVIYDVTFLELVEPYVWRGRKTMRKAKWLCHCGNEFIATINNVTKQHTRSCGCIMKGSNKTHGLSHTVDYVTWASVKSRCCSEVDFAYEFYGGRGIKLADYWVDNPVDFIEYIKSLPNYGEKYYSLDRIDNEGNYEKGNLRWADKHTQSVNTRKRKTSKKKYTGVYLNKRERLSPWYCQITVRSELIHIGSYKCETKAVYERDRYIIENNLTEYKLQMLKRA